MKFRDIRSKLALHLRPGTRYPDLDVMALKTKPQTGSTLMQLPLEIRIAIFQELCDAAGLSQHIMFQDGHYVRARCVTDHAASDGLMEECARFNMTRFDDPLIWGRLMSTWGNHWKCEELYQSMKQTSWSPFLAMMLACRQLYFEWRASIYSTITFVLHDLGTLYNFTGSHRSPVLNEMKYLQLAIRLPIHSELKEKLGPVAHDIMARWRKCCQALDQVENLVLVDLWLDTSEASRRSVLSSLPKGNANPFVFGERLASVLIVDIPANPARPEAWQDVANIEPQFAIRARGWPGFIAKTDTMRSPNTILQLWDSAEPGVAEPPMIQRVQYRNTGFRRGRRRWIF